MAITDEQMKNLNEQAERYVQLLGTQFEKSFAEVVKTHVKTLSAAEYDSYRLYARHNVPREAPKELTNPAFDHDRELLVDEATCDDGISISELFENFAASNAEVIGQVEGQPVYYMRDRGMYFWGLDPKEGSTLGVWLTTPAYPKDW